MSKVPTVFQQNQNIILYQQVPYMPTYIPTFVYEIKFVNDKNDCESENA